MRGTLILSLLALAAKGAEAACGTGCLAAKIDPAAIASYPVTIETKFNAPYSNYAATTNSPPMAFGICYVLGCNYRNVSVIYFNGDTAGKQDFAYRVVFYNYVGSSNITAFPAALSAALPSTTPTTAGTIAFGMAYTQGGALSTLTGVYAGAGPFAVPPSPPVPPVASPPPPPASPPPPVASPPPPTASPPPPPVSQPVPPTIVAPAGATVFVPPLPSITVVGNVINFDGSASTSDGAISAIVVTLAAPKTGSQLITLAASYAGADNHYRHLFNLDGVAAVLHQAEIWVGNNNGNSTGCARGFAVPASWTVGTMADLGFSMLANGTIGDLTVNGVAAGPAAVDPTYMAISACTPISIRASVKLFVGGSGNVGYTDNWMGGVSGFSF